MKQKKGSALLLSMILLFVVLSLVASLSYVTVMEQNISQKTKSSVGAFYNADSGVEWALHKIATTSATDVYNTFGANPGSGYSPNESSNYKVYLLDKEGNVIIDQNETVSNIKAVRAVGTQTAGESTQRAIEAAVAAGGGGCYVSYGNPPSPAPAPNAHCLTGFIDKGSVGTFGFCTQNAGGNAFWRAPAATCGGGYSPQNATDAYLCCQS